LPEALRLALKLPVDVYPVALKEQALLRLEVSGERPVSHWVYALVAPFPTIDDGASSGSALRAFWGGNPVWLLLVDESNSGSPFSLCGSAFADGAVQVVPSAELLSYAWDHRPSPSCL
jgi:hypothetical protein